MSDDWLSAHRKAGAEKTRWSAEKRGRLSETQARMLEIPEVLAAIESRTVLTLTCPRGHRLFPAVLEQPEGWPVMLRPLNDFGRASQAVTTNGSMSTGGKVCMELDCRNLVVDEGRCESHGGRSAIYIHPESTRYTCLVKKCYSDRVPQDRLLKVVTRALVDGITRIPVSGSTARRARPKR